VPEAHLAFADYYFDQGELADAEARYKMVLKFPKSRAYWYAMYKLGWVHLDLQRFQEALEVFFQTAQATKNDPSVEGLHREAARDFVRAYAQIGRADRAYDAFRRVDAAAVKDMLELYGDVSVAQAKLDAAATAYRRLLQLDPKGSAACGWQGKLVGVVTGTPQERREAAALAAMKQCTAVVAPTPAQQVAGPNAAHVNGAMPADVVLTAPPKKAALAELIPDDELATLAELARAADTLSADEVVRAKLLEAAIYRAHAHHDEAIARLADIIEHHRDQPLAEVAADLWLDSLIQLHRFDAALEVVDRLAADTSFLADKPTLRKNIAFLRSRSLR
jgi:tetratricopeptide (TPR) repeat protein